MTRERKTCIFEGCDRPNFAHGYCQAHAAQIRRGVALRPIRSPRPEAPKGQRYCSRCKEFLDEEFFSPDKVRGGLQRVCRPCKAAYMRAYVAENRVTHRRKAGLGRWGLTPEQYQLLEDAQDGKCAVCQRPPRAGKRLHLDHDHKTGAVRGLCCNECNLGMGQLQDDPELLERAAAYLRAGGVIPAELAFSVDPESFGQRRTEIRRRAAIKKDETRGVVADASRVVRERGVDDAGG